MLIPQHVAAINPQNVLVAWNENPAISSTSQAVAIYYANARGIPSSNVVALQTTKEEWITDIYYIDQIASPLWTNYLSRPEYSHIKCIVLCYGIPSRIIYQPNYDMSVDSALTLLGNPGVPNAQGEFARHWGLNLSNPFRGKNAGFDDFRASAENAMQVTIDGHQVTWKLNYLVTRLDAFSQPTVNVNGVNIPRDVKAMIDRSTAAAPGGNFVVDRSASDVNSVIQRFTSDGISTENIITNSTSVFLTGQQDVIGYWGEHMIIDGNANNYTTWTRPLHHWHNGIVYAQLFVKRR
jgi:uncharacterized protein (TIGR03790 family)